VAAIEFFVRDPIPVRPKLRDDWTTRLINGQDVVTPAVTDEHDRASGSRSGRNEPGRERADMREQVAAREPCGQRIRRAIREASNRKALGIDRTAIERVIERALEECNVRTEAAENGIPRPVIPRVRREDDDAVVLSGFVQKSHSRRAAGGTVQHHGERRGGLRAVRPRNE
jgi:hypothetical protein